jgi:hypothetical protein
MPDETASHSTKQQHLQSEENCQSCLITSHKRRDYRKASKLSPSVSREELAVVNQRKFLDFTLFIQNLDLLFLDEVQ